MVKKRIHYSWYIAASCCAIMLTGIGINSSCAGIFLRPMADEMGIGMANASLLLTIRAVSMTVTTPLANKLLQKFDLRVMLTTALTIQCAAFASIGFCSSMTQIYILGAVIGIAAAFISYMPVPMLLNNWFRKHVGFIMGVALSFSGLGAAIFNPIGNYFIINFGWRSGHFALGIMGYILVLPFVAFVIRRTPEEKGTHPFGMDESVTAANAPRAGITAREAYRTPAFYMLLISACSIMVVGSFLSHMSAFAQSFGFNSSVAALSVSILTIGVVVGKLLIGSANDRVGIGATTTTAISVGIVGTVILFVCYGNSVMLYVGSALLGIATALPTMSPPLSVATVFGHLEYTKIYSVVSVMTAMSMAVCLTVFGVVYDMTGSYIYNLYFVAISLVVAMVSMLLALRFGKNVTFHQSNDAAAAR